MSEGNHSLSPRQIEVLGLMAGGDTAKEIAAVLGITVGTVRAVQEKLYARLNVANAAQAVAEGFRQGYLEGAA